MYTVKIQKTAKADVTNACEWYEKKQKGLSLRFLKEMRRYSQLLSKTPYLFNVRFSEDLRFAKLDIFPYLIAYHIDESTKTVYISAVWHTSRDPHQF